jgi:hypothetical protein
MVGVQNICPALTWICRAKALLKSHWFTGKMLAL